MTSSKESGLESVWIIFQGTRKDLWMYKAKQSPQGTLSPYKVVPIPCMEVSADVTRKRVNRTRPSEPPGRFSSIKWCSDPIKSVPCYRGHIIISSEMEFGPMLRMFPKITVGPTPPIFQCLTKLVR